MTSARPPERLEVPVERLAGGRGNSRRAATVAVAIVAIVGGAFGIARLSERASAPLDARAPTPSADPVASSAPVPSRSPGTARTEQLLPIERVALPGAPEVTLAERAGADGTDLRVFVWTPDDARTRTVRVIAGALHGPDANEYPLLAPNRGHVLVLAADGPGASSDRATLIDDRGTVVWKGDHLAAASGGLWSADSRLVVVTGQPRTWHLVHLERPGHATDTKVSIPGDVYLPNPIPQGSITLPPLEPRTIPLGFSADGSWVYGAVISPDLGVVIGEFRVRSDGSDVEKLIDFRVGKPDGLVPRPGTQGIRFIDPASGRVMTSRINSDTTGGPRTVEIRSPDAAFLFDIGGGVPLGSEWGDDGAVYALTGDTLLYPNEVVLRRIDPDGRSDPPLVTTGPLTGAALVGVRDGYAILGLLATRPEGGAQLVAVDLAHPERRTSLPLAADAEILFATVDR